MQLIQYLHVYLTTARGEPERYQYCFDPSTIKSESLAEISNVSRRRNRRARDYQDTHAEYFSHTQTYVTPEWWSNLSKGGLVYIIYYNHPFTLH